MNKLIEMLQEAFEAGMSCAAAYEHGTYSVNFKKWVEENKSEIEELHRRLLILSDGYRQYRRNEDDAESSNHGDRHSGWSV